ncbi:hypothetical protein C1645_779425 [Glomus cerebriforme]|uniref:Uncharacterized protein n=1 Tax=Glomus cerebriforme TaxID=658196 RepID=A0A397SPN1_9GLOM|nr:hypothetical protein C1645_779425 [Glomus cerebriforme]
MSFFLEKKENPILISVQFDKKFEAIYYLKIIIARQHREMIKRAIFNPFKVFTYH